MKRFHILVGAMAALFVLSTAPASAANLEIPIDTVVVAPPGTVRVLTVVDTPPELIGSSCVGIAVAGNGPSVHPNNDLIIESGGTQVVLADVEREPGAVTPAAGNVTLGETITISLRMGGDGVFSGGLVVVVGDNCTPPTTTPPTTEPPTPTTEPPPPDPAIEIIKDATPEFYGEDGIGFFTITVKNPGPVPLTDVHVTDDVALAVDANSDCPNPDVPDLAVGDSFTYECSIGNLDGVSPFENIATAIGTGPRGKQVTDTDPATVFPPVKNTTITQPPTTEAPATTEAPGETLPVTGPVEEVQGFAFAGVGLFLAGLALLGGAALIGRMREER